MLILTVYILVFLGLPDLLALVDAAVLSVTLEELVGEIEDEKDSA